MYKEAKPLSVPWPELPIGLDIEEYRLDAVHIALYAGVCTTRTSIESMMLYNHLSLVHTAQRHSDMSVHVGNAMWQIVRLEFRSPPALSPSSRATAEPAGGF